MPELNFSKKSLNKIHTLSKDFYRIFGSQDAKGAISFFDAYPDKSSLNKSENIYKTDIINVHYQPYYENMDNPPADYYNPIPIYFLTVAPGVKFNFFLILRSKDKQDKQLLDKAKDWLSKALKENGVGSKTAVGYGQMETIKE